MDEEASFSALLSSTTPARPSWSSPNVQADDPWANPFSDSTSTSSINPYASPFASTASPIINDPAIQPFGLAETDLPRIETSPYIQKIKENDDNINQRLPDPPSVIAAREQNNYSPPKTNEGIYRNPYSEDDPFSNVGQNKMVDPAIKPFEPPSHSPIEEKKEQQKPKGLPSSLIDEDLMAESDPEQSLKKAFVKSTPQPKSSTSNSNQVKATVEKKTYVFTPNAKNVKEEKRFEEVKKESEKDNKGSGVDVNGKQDKEDVDLVDKQDEPSVKVEKKESEETLQIPTKASDNDITPTQEQPPSSGHTTPTVRSPKSPTSIPLPQSNLATPIISRIPTPLPPANNVKTDNAESSSVLATPSTDRVSVSPLEAPSASTLEEDYGFKSLSIGGSAPPVPDKEWNAASTSSSNAISPSGPRFGGKGWGALDDETEGDSLFGRGGPSVSSWSNEHSSGGWGETSMEDALTSAGPSASSYRINGSPTTTTRSTSGDRPSSPEDTVSTPTTSSPRKKLSNTPVFQITVSDPAKVGDPVRGYTVYTVRTQTTSPHYRKGTFSVLRRFSDFLWLLEILTFNNPGIVLPPMPGKHTFGRFQDQFIETRRNALQKFITKITSHPVLQLDPDLRIFLESDNFSIDSKNRKNEILILEKSQALSADRIWNTNKFIEFDDWFESRNGFLNSLENQLKNLSKSIEQSSKLKLELSNSILEFSENILILSESDLNFELIENLKKLNLILKEEKELNENQAKFQVINLLNLTDEYIKIINQVKIAFNGRIKSYNQWQQSEKELTRLKNNKSKNNNNGKLINNNFNDIIEAERTVRENHINFENLTKLTKNEFIRFERGRIEEFKLTLEIFLNDLIEKQKSLIEMWEEFHKSLLSVIVDKVKE
ncbi:uncharacterized protein I206_104878 [Kwoniella pini CBS 10737]|uniref:PX domain-containing protein n=1 Tax=Kwoniella pini CBS 10737 TaxID=1296096 RepID=A0A1B9I865_9TREE|nr:uncharacterized protein I206_02418 [Kwoniella pini CBS 10737]OCF51703.1 hypothetical protein I206_02418 [Kwoniella pini CBS 10737]